MRIVVTGATGNVGTSVLASLAGDPNVESILGIARREPRVLHPKTEWLAADIRGADLTAAFRGADAVVHLAWMIQPSHDEAELRSTNIDGSARVFRAVADARVPSLVYASSVGAYSPGPKDRHVDETWPTDGIATSTYSRHKAAVERMLDAFEREHPEIRVVRLRKALVFKREAASEIRRLFLGPLFPAFMLRRLLVVPAIANLRVQGVHSRDAGEAYRLAVTRDVRGAFNVAADPVIDVELLARLFEATPIPVPASLARAAVALTWRLRLQPSDVGWLDLALRSPLLDATRAHAALGWMPHRRADDALREVVEGIVAGAGAETPPLIPATARR